MRIDKHKDDCCGCTLCSTICPKNAITMKPDALGFLYPMIDDSLCIDCGLCEKYCAFSPNYKTDNRLATPLAYGGRHKDLTEVAKSQSGAAFVVLSDYILSLGGVIYGAGYKDHFRVAHKRAVNAEERDEFRGSKYVQSDMTGIFDAIRTDLDNNNIVMFSGTPCQTAAVSSCFAKHKNRDNLYLMDLVCHGVPGPFVWRDYLNYLEEQQGDKLTKVNFRDKSYKGWHAHVESFTYSHAYTYTYTYLFYSHINLRYSCANCPYTNLRRTSDVTVADFWGVEKSKAARLGEDNKGCSLFIVNTPKGMDWFEKINRNLDYIQVGLDEILQPQLCHPAKLHKNRDVFENDFNVHGFSFVRRKYGNVGINYIINKIKSIIRPFYYKIKR
jgi:coenzyme F420-reducing hydrogenase beta subunit